MELTVEQRVTNGVEWLDSTVPGWEDRITLPAFNIRNACTCVCGQIFKEEAADSLRESRTSSYNGFYYACDTYDDFQWDHMSWAMYHGFDADGVGADYSALQSEWESVIKERQDALVTV